jgi:RNA polymerase sigma-70 factor (ECF subfamily)
VDAPAAFRQQLLAAIPRLRRYARSLVFDTAQADDLVQTALARALSHWHQFDQRRDILVWLLSIAHNAHLDERRRDARWAPVDADQPGHEPVAPAADIGLRIDIVAALHRLPDAQREVLLLIGVEQLSYAECAEVLRVPLGTVMSRLSRARVALRGLLDGSVQAAPRTLRRVV